MIRHEKSSSHVSLSEESITQFSNHLNDILKESIEALDIDVVMRKIVAVDVIIDGRFIMYCFR